MYRGSTVVAMSFRSNNTCICWCELRLFRSARCPLFMTSMRSKCLSRKPSRVNVSSWLRRVHGRSTGFALLDISVPFRIGSGAGTSTKHYKSQAMKKSDEMTQTEWNLNSPVSIPRKAPCPPANDLWHLGCSVSMQPRRHA